MRILAGALKGTSLAMPPPSFDMRPTLSRVRQRLFDVLSHRRVLHDARVLELYAGTGALGLEAYSRGARHVCFIETQPAVLRRNILACKAEHICHVIAADALASHALEPFDVILADPPYDSVAPEVLLTHIHRRGWLESHGLVVFQSSVAAFALPSPWVLVDRRLCGKTVLSFLQTTL